MSCWTEGLRSFLLVDWRPPSVPRLMGASKPAHDMDTGGSVILGIGHASA